MSLLPRDRQELGFTLAEVLVALVVVATGILLLSETASRVERGRVSLLEEARGRGLAREIYAEIAAAPRGDTVGFLAAGTPRSEFRSVLDFDGLEESPPRDPLGTPIPGCERWSRRVALRRVDPLDLARPEPESPLIEATVVVEKDGRAIARLAFHRSLR